ncbi:MAG: hypothetical protein J5842_02610 [Lachnospiraceae bacterium]|nr:hypothetical protein [Lachnospiraceae bacterium]
MPPASVILILAAIVIYTLFFLNHLMHSDMAAEVILSKLLRDEGRLITDSWYYSTEIRIIYSHLIMTPLFYIFSDYHTVKVISIFIFLILLFLAFRFIAGKLQLQHAAFFTALLMLVAPWSNEYLDMMFLGNFYTSQTICMYIFIAAVIAGAGVMRNEKSAGSGSGQKKRTPKEWIALLEPYVLAVFSVLLGLSGMRYLACLFAPLLLALGLMYLEGEKSFISSAIRMLIYTCSSFAGFLIHKFYLSTHYSFDDTSSLDFLPLSEVPDRFMKALSQMIEFFGYRDGVSVTSPLGLVNVIRFFFFMALIYMVARLFKDRRSLSLRERLLLYYFGFHFVINLYILIFTDVLMQYRYWIPVYIILILLVGIYVQKYLTGSSAAGMLLMLFLCFSALSSLYGELWQDVKFDDCKKREGYMAFLEKEGYDFGYATFWNGPVTEYLSNGKIQVGDFTADDQGNIVPYEWLTRKAYYKKGYHEGKTFLLLARTEEAGMLNGEYSVMEDPKKVYEDEYYSVYEGKGMSLFSK